MKLQDLNFKHLLYFHMVISRGSVSEAAAAMHVSQPTVSTQLRRLEQQLGAPLLQRSGRGLVPTEFGQLVARYADDIFGIGRELLQAAQDPAGSYASVVNIGIADVVPHPLAARLLDRIVAMDSQHARVFMGHPTELLAQLAVHKLDVVISDAPINEPVHHIRAFNHLLGSSAVTFLAPAPLAAELRPDFPHSLHQQPMLLPTMNTVLRRALEHWLEVLQIEPLVHTEVENPALLMSLGELGWGAFPALSVVAEQIIHRYNVEPIGQVDNIEARFYAISAERRIRHPAVVALSRTAHEDLFSAGEKG